VCPSSPECCRCMYASCALSSASGECDPCMYAPGARMLSTRGSVWCVKCISMT
jgi:hypothetical protein